MPMTRLRGRSRRCAARSALHPCPGRRRTSSYSANQRVELVVGERERLLAAADAEQAQNSAAPPRRHGPQILTRVSDHEQLRRLLHDSSITASVRSSRRIELASHRRTGALPSRPEPTAVRAADPAAANCSSSSRHATRRSLRAGRCHRARWPPGPPRPAAPGPRPRALVQLVEARLRGLREPGPASSGPRPPRCDRTGGRRGSRAASTRNRPPPLAVRPGSGAGRAGA